ncbi:MAG: TetR/AcrR family transcriptional regulator [Candidatus Sericytochromatia bacterium]
MEKHLKIIQAAQQLFVRHGFHKVSMSDIAKASGMSRPSLYAAFANKEAVISALVALHLEDNHAQTALRLQPEQELRSQLACLFEIWIIAPFASVIDFAYGKDFMAETAEQAPEAIDQIYEQFAHYVTQLLSPHMPPDAPLSAADMARILALATKGLKTTSADLADLERLTQGLITMTLATLAARPEETRA